MSVTSLFPEIARLTGWAGKNLLFGFILIVGFCSHAAEISVGVTRLSVPAPSGFGEVTGSMQPYADLAKHFVAPVNEQFVQFLPTNEVMLAAQGEVPEAARRFSIQADKNTIHTPLTAADFMALKKVFREQLGEIMKKVEKELPGYLKKAGEDISKEQQVKVSFTAPKMIPFPPHHESDRSLSYSMLVRQDMTTPDGKPLSMEGTVTMAYVHLKGKLLFFYTFAEKTGLEWSRTENEKWVQATIAANASTGETADLEKRASTRGFNWDRVWFGALVGGVFGLLRYLFQRKKNAETGTNA